jgi:hypothetical protein
MHLIYSIKNGCGKIEGSLSCPDSLIEMQKKNLPTWQRLFEYTGSVDGEKYYYDLINTIRFRLNLPCVFSKKTISTDLIEGEPDTISITNIPAPAIITIDDQIEETSEGELTFTIDLPGTYIIKIECFPYITKEYTVTAI